MIAVSLSHINNTNEMYKRMVGLCRANDRYVDTLDSPTDALLLTWKLNVDRRGYVTQSAGMDKTSSRCFRFLQYFTSRAVK